MYNIDSQLRFITLNCLFLIEGGLVLTAMRYACIAAYILSAIHCLAASKEVSIKTIQGTKRSVVPIVCGYLNEQKQFQVVEVAGSGFFVDILGRFVTAGHVLDNWDKISTEKHACFPAIYIPDHGWGRYEQNIPFHSFAFVSCVRDSTVDLAVCQPGENPFKSPKVPNGIIAPVSFDTQEWPDGTPIAFTGFPLEYVFPVTSKGFIAGHMASSGSDLAFDYIIDKAAWPGASGSLVYLSNGKVIGIIRLRGQNEGVGLAYARSASVIVDFLAKHPATVSDQKQTQNPITRNVPAKSLRITQPEQ